jgi:hypothetical protein
MSQLDVHPTVLAIKFIKSASIYFEFHRSDFELGRFKNIGFQTN